MNTKEAAILSFLSKAAQGRASMPSRLIKEFSEACAEALNKQFNAQDNDFRLRMSNAGKPLCQLQMQSKNAKAETPSYDFKMSKSFLYGGTTTDNALIYEKFLNQSLKKFIEYQR